MGSLDGLVWSKVVNLDCEAILWLANDGVDDEDDEDGDSGSGDEDALLSSKNSGDVGSVGSGDKEEKTLLGGFELNEQILPVAR